MNLFSLTSVLSNGGKLSSNDRNNIMIKQNDIEIVFDHQIKAHKVLRQSNEDGQQVEQSVTKNCKDSSKRKRFSKVKSYQNKKSFSRKRAVRNINRYNKALAIHLRPLLVQQKN